MFVDIDGVNYNTSNFTAYERKGTEENPFQLEISYNGGSKFTISFNSELELEEFANSLSYTFININYVFYNSIYFTSYYLEDIKTPSELFRLVINYNGGTKLIDDFQSEAERQIIIDRINQVAGGGAGAVTSVNGLQGDVTLTSNDIRTSDGNTIADYLYMFYNNIDTLKSEDTDLGSRINTLENIFNEVLTDEY